MTDKWIDKKMIVVKIITGLFLMSLLVAGSLVYWAVLSGKIVPKMYGNITFKLIITVVAIMTGIFSFIMRGMLLSEKNLLKMNKKFTSPDPSINTEHYTIFQKYFMGYIVLLALSESVGMYGLLLMMTTADKLYLFGLLMLSAILMFVHFPRREKIEGMIQKMEMQKSIGLQD